MTFWETAVGGGRGERARQRMAEVWALKRKASAKDMEGVSASDISFKLRTCFGIVAVIPCSVRSYDPVII
jgi:hypothetical protein